MASVSRASSFAPPPRTASFNAEAAAAAALGAQAGPAVVPTDLCYGSRVGLRACHGQRYVAAYPRRGVGEAVFDLEVSGFHPFRQGETVDRAAECPSEWIILQWSSRQHRGPVHLGDEICFAKELGAAGERKAGQPREVYAYLSLEPAATGDAMEPVVERREGNELARWTVVHAEEASRTGALQADMPVLIRGKYSECLALGRHLWEGAGALAGSGGGAGFRSPARISGRGLLCRGRDGRSPEQRFRIVKAGVPFGIEPELRPAAPLGPPPASQGDAGAGSLATMALGEQERALLDDALYALLGFDGVYVRRQPATASGEGQRATAPAEVHFSIEAPAGADASNVQFLRQLLPLCEQHAAVQHFVEVQAQYEYGTVNHALCAAIRELLKEFAVRVGHLETSLRGGSLSIAKLWYHVQPSMDTFAVLHRVTSRVYGLIGGQVLNGIEEAMSRSSLTTAQDLCEYLLQQASLPYFETVSKWVYEGRLEDPYHEFFISQSPRVRDERSEGPAAGFWQRHFTLDERAVPHFLGSSREKILHAGKYLHVFFSVASAGQLPEPGNRGLLRYSRRQRDYAEAIDEAYRRASAALLGLFMRRAPEGLDLPGRLRSMRSFFFLARGDWFGQLMDTATAELEQPAQEVPLARLESLVDLAVRASSAASDPYHDDISCGLHSFRVEDACHRISRGHGLPGEDLDEDGAGRGGAGSPVGSEAGSVAGRSAAASLAPTAASAAGATTAGGAGAAGAGNLSVAGDGSGVRCFTLKYRTSWPLSIVFSRELLLKYQVIFRHLLYCRYVERKLVEVWVDHQYTKELGLDTSFSPSYSLRQRMLHFCRDYIYYATVEVLEPQSHHFLDQLARAETVDEVLKNHEVFLNTCLQELLLTEREGLYRHLSKVLQTCLTFAYNLHRFNNNFAETQKTEDLPAGHVPAQAQSQAEGRLARVRQSTQAYLSLLSQRHYSKMISKFKVIFESQLQGFLRQIQQESTTRYEHFLSNLATRLDYNDYYSSVLASAAAAAPAEG